MNLTLITLMAMIGLTCCSDITLKEITCYSAEDAKFMQMAIDLSIENIDNGGGPFGAVCV